MIIVIPIEIKIREFLPKLYLTYQIIKKTDAEVLFAGQRFISNKIKEFKNVIYFDKNTHHSRLLIDSYKLEKNIVCMLDEEGPVSLFDQDTLHIRYNKKIKKIINHIFLWGKKDLSNFKVNPYSKNKTFVIGHPKFDLLNKNNLKIFDDQVKKIKKKYKKFIFFPSSFESDPDKNLYVLKSQFKTYFSDFSTEKINNKINQKIKERRISQKNYNKTVEMLIQLARENPTINIVFRKHPYEDKEDITSRFKSKPKNLHLVYKYNVTPWIIASTIYIHSGCTTSLEAAILRKKIIMYKPYSDNSIREKELSKLGKFFKNKKKLIIAAKKNLNSNKFQRSYKIKNLIYNDDANSLFHKSFIKYLSNYKNLKSQIIFHPKEGIIKTNLLNLKIFLFKVLSILKNLILSTNLAEYIPEKYSFSKKATLNKLQDLKKSEIQKFFFLFSKNEKKIKIDINKIDNGVFLIKKSTKVN